MIKMRKKQLSLLIIVSQLSIFFILPNQAISTFEGSFTSKVYNFTLNENKTSIVLPDSLESVNIGKTWNLTFNVYSDSTSGIKVSLIEYSYEYLKGNSSFVVEINSSITEQFVLHGVCDDVPYYNFNISIIDTSAISYGQVIVEAVNSGYFIGFGTGCVYIYNITHWLEKQSKTIETVEETSEITSVSSPFPILEVSLVCIIFFSTRRMKKRYFR